MVTIVRIRDAAEQLGVSPSSLRKWERDGLIPRVARSRSGQRVYSLQDLAAIRDAIVPNGKEQ